MLERDVIESGITKLLASLERLQLEIYSLQAGAVNSALSGTNRAQAIKTAQAEIRRLANEIKGESSAALKHEILKLASDDLGAQMTVYNRAWNAGIITTKPVISKAIQASVTKQTAATQMFINETIDRIHRYAGVKVGTVIDMAMDDKLKGVALDKITRTASQLIIEEGIKFTTPSGRNVHDIYAYVRRNVVTSVAVDSGNRQHELFNSLDIDESKKWVETSSHWGARPDHAEWQGRIFKSWDEFVLATGYGEIDGLGGINCRHTFYPFIPGISERQFSPKPLKENDRRYDARQEQRSMESMIRKLKAEDAVNVGLGKDAENKGKIKSLTSNLNKQVSAQKEAAKRYQQAA